MSEGFVSAMIRRMNLKMLAISLVGLLVVIVILALSSRYILNLIQGPQAIQRQDLLSLTDASHLARYYVTVQGDDTGDTGITYVSTSSSGVKTTQAYYLALVIGDRFLLVRSPTATIGKTVTGSLGNFSADVNTNVIAKVEANTPSLKGAFLPVMLDTRNFLARGEVGLGLAAVLVLICLLGAGLAFFRLLMPAAHPALKALKRFGDPEAVAREIDMDMAMNPELVGKHIRLTNHWLVSTRNGFQAVPFKDVVWVYKLVTQHRTYGIPTRKTFAARIYDRFSSAITIAEKEAGVNKIVEAVARRTPGVVAGYSNDILKLWNQDRVAFINTVDARRQSGAGS